MKISKILFILAAVSVLSFGFFAVTVHAQDIMTGLKTTASSAGLPGKPSGGFEAAIGAVIGSVMGLVGTLLFVYMLYGGVRWMMAGGDNKAVTEAQSIIRNAIIGIAIIVFAYVLANYVITTLGTVASGGGSATQTSGTAQTTCSGTCQGTGMACLNGDGQGTCPTGQHCCK